MATPFTRTMRSLEADRGWGVRLVWVVAVLLGAAWILWFTTAEIEFEGARSTPARMLLRQVKQR